MITYRDTFHVDGGRFGIEDYEVPGDHFFPKHYKKGKCKRFKLWSNGCSIGEAETIDEARKLMHAHIVTELKNRHECLTTALNATTTALERLGNDWFNLGLFVEEKKR